MTKTMWTGLLGYLFIAMLVAAPARAADRQSQAYAVLVGISHYADPQIKPRPHAEADATALYDLLINKDYLGTKADNVRLLLGSADAKRPSEPASHENIIKALRWVAATANPDDLVIFAFIGEGAPLGDKACYLASDSTFKDRAKNSVATTDIASALEKLKSQRFCVFLDANFKGFDSGKDPAPELDLSNFFKFNEYLGSDDQSPIGRAIFLATLRGVTTSLDLKDHGLFTQALLQGLKGAADKEGYEPDGLVTVDELTTFLDKRIPELARQYGKSKQEKEQLPVILQSESCHFVLTHNPAVMPKVRERLAKFNKLAKEEKLSHALTEEGRNLLMRMPKFEAYRSLRKEYQHLADGALSLADFKKQRTHLLNDMKVKRPDALEYAAKIIRATQIIDGEYVKEVSQGELIGWAIRGLYRSIEEKIPQDIKEHLDKVKDLSEAKLTNLLADVRQRLGKRDDLDNHKDIDLALKGMTRHLDPYTTYIDPETLARFKEETSGNFRGIGIQIRKDSATDMLRVITPIKGSPAYKAGIKTGDIITQVICEVDKKGNPLEKPEVTSTKGLPLTEAVSIIKGKPGTKVKLIVEREGESKPLEFEINRGLVEMESVLGVKRNADDSWDYVIDPANRICYFRLTSFQRHTARDLVGALATLERAGIKGVIMDLRSNPGGLLQSARDICDIFIDGGLIVTIKPRVGQKVTYRKESDLSLTDFPMVVLIDNGSASGSEIVAACLQDHDRAIIMGERSFGKGSVQNIQPFEDGDLKLTTARYWRPSGKNIHREPNSKETDVWGVTPNKGFVVKLSRKERVQLEMHLRDLEIIPRRDLPAKEVKAPFKDRQLEMAVNYLREQIKLASKAALKKAG